MSPSLRLALLMLLGVAAVAPLLTFEEPAIRVVAGMTVAWCLLWFFIFLRRHRRSR